MKKRILSILLICCMVLTMLPATALAEESGQTGGGVTASGLCEHHPAHDDECGYTEGTAGTPCSHEHTDDCYTEVTDCVHEHTEDCYPQNSVSGNNATSSNADEPTECTHVCSEESGCITKQLNCQHEHDEDCGYTPATAGTPCGYVCEICGAEGNAAEAMTVERVQAMIDALPDAEEITEDNAEEVTAQLEAIDEAKAELTDEEIDELDITRYMAAAAALGSLAAPMLLANAAPAEQFKLTPGGTYWFDLSGENIPGTVNTGNSYGAVSVPDTTLHYVPFTYAGTVDAYKLTSEMVTTEDYATQNKYPHSLFVADYAVTHTVSWDELNNAGLIFGKSYTGGSVDYTLRAPSVGSWYTGSGDSAHGTPQSNEWDAVLDKNSSYIKNWYRMLSWGQDTARSGSSYHALRGYSSARNWDFSSATYQYVIVGFRPVLEVLNTDTLGSDGLKAVTLDLNGGKLGGSTDNIQIIVKNGAAFTAPASDGLTAPQVGYSAQWQDSDGNLYAPGDSVPADVTTLTAQWTPAEQFNLTPGGTYWFDLSGENIPGTVNTGNSYGAVSVPDTTLHYVPFTYAGTVDAYKLTSEMVTTEDYATQNKYPHSLFVADYAVTHTVSWEELNTAGLIFGRSYTGGSVDYTLRAPSGGSGRTRPGDSEPGTPQSNEWDAVLDKNSGYIKNWGGMYSRGQDTVSNYLHCRAARGFVSARRFSDYVATARYDNAGFRPVLEVLNTDELGPDGLKAVTLDLNGGKLGGSTDDIQIIVKNGAAFTAPASDGLTRPDGDTGDYFKWLGSDGNLYAPGDSVPAGVTTLTAQWMPAEQFNLTPGGTYWFDLSGENIPGTVNTGNSSGAVSVPDTTLHYVPFTYAGTVEAYKLTSAMETTEDYAEQNKYPHSLFVADYAVTHTVSWNELNTAGLIFGKSYTGGSVDYTLRAPSVGSWYTGLGDSARGTPQSNEWDAVLDKNSGYIKNWNDMYSQGQDTSISSSNCAIRGCSPARYWIDGHATYQHVSVGFRPVLEVLNTDTLGSDGLKAVTLDLNGGKLGGSTDDIQIIVKNGAAFTAPASDGLTAPQVGYSAQWQDSDGNLYAPGDSVPAGVTTLTAQWMPDTYTVTLHLNDGTIGNGKNVTEYTYGTGATLLTADDITRAGHTFEGWYEDENFSGSPVTEISATDTGKKEFYAKWTLNTYTVTFDSQGGSKVDSQTVSHGGTVTEPTAPTYEGYTFGGWYTEAGCTTEYDFTTAVTESLTLYAKWKDVTCPTGEITVDKSKWNTFFNNITFGLFFKDTQKVTITASDNSGDNVTITYLLSDKELTVDELNVSVFTAYTGAFYIEPNNEYVIYAKLTDSSGNICYINSNGVVLDNVDPLISGIIDGKTYCEAQTVTIDEKYVDSVTVDGTAVTLTDGKFTLSPADGKQTIVVTDKAGNKAEMTVTVNDGHTGGTATCTEKAKCEVCGTAYGEINANNHTDLKHIKAKAATKNAEGNIEYWYCEDCGKYFSDADAKNEITKAATVIAKLTDDTKSPQTGDNSHMVLWFALLFVSCGGIITTIYIGKRKKKKSE